MKKFLVVWLGVIFFSGCVANSAPQKKENRIDEPVAVASSVSTILTQEMIDRFNKTHAKR